MVIIHPESRVEETSSQRSCEAMREKFYTAIGRFRFKMKEEENTVTSSISISRILTHLLR